MTVSIREAKESDVAVIRELAIRIWWPVYRPILPEDQIAYMLEKIYSPGAILTAMHDGSQRFLVLLEDDVPTGFASYGNHPGMENTMKVFKLYVLPDCQGKGYGRKLLDDIRARAISTGVQNLILNVNRFNPALQFYQKYGFTILKEEDIPIGPFFMNDYVMILSGLVPQSA